MTDPASTLNAKEIHERLPDGWGVKSSSDRAVYGCAEGPEAEDLPDLPEMPASFAIQYQGHNWSATWKGPHKLGGDINEFTKRTHGTREHCIEWIAGKVAALERDTNV